MSTARDGETTRIVDSFYTLRDRLDYLFDHAQIPSNDAATLSRLQKLGECRRFLNLWQREHLDLSRHTFRDGPAMNEEKVSRIHKRIDEANALLPHCEYLLKISYPGAPQPDPRITEDNRRHDCFSALERTLRELQHPSPLSFAMPVPVIGSPPSTNPPRTSPAPSPYIAASPNPAPPSSRVSPAYHEAPHPNDEPQAFVEQEQQSDHFMASESPDRSHLRKDSHLGSQGTQNSPHMEKLPPISSFQMPSSLAQIPTTTGYGPILPRPSQMKHSPPMNCASSPQSPYHSGAINGNDRQTVMMSPNTMLRPLQPPFSITTVPTMLTSIFNDHRPQSRPNGSPPEH